MLTALLLVAALACLVVGLLLASTAWLILSLAASLLAGSLLFLNRGRIARTAPYSAPTGAGLRRSTHAASTAARGGGAPLSAVASTTQRADVWVVDGRPRYHRQDCQSVAAQNAEPIPWTRATGEGFIACSLCEPDRADAGVDGPPIQRPS